MEDTVIVQLYWDRDEEAIPATSEKYGRYCHSIAGNILENREDVEECVSDTYLNAWNSMPPHRPGLLSAFLGKITRNLSFNRYKHNHTQKRGGGQLPLVLEELEECISGKTTPEEEWEKKELTQSINSFLAALPMKKRKLFVCRYWYADSVSEIAESFGMSENAVSVTLNRLRKNLRDFLTEGGFLL